MEVLKMRIIIELNAKEKAKFKSVKNNVKSVIGEIEKVINAFKEYVPKVTVR